MRMLNEWEKKGKRSLAGRFVKNSAGMKEMKPARLLVAAGLRIKFSSGKKGAG